MDLQPWIEAALDPLDRTGEVRKDLQSEYSAWNGTSTASAAIGALSVRKPREGGQSIRTA